VNRLSTIEPGAQLPFGSTPLPPPRAAFPPPAPAAAARPDLPPRYLPPAGVPPGTRCLAGRCRAHEVMGKGKVAAEPPKRTRTRSFGGPAPRATATLGSGRRRRPAGRRSPGWLAPLAPGVPGWPLAASWLALGAALGAFPPPEKAQASRARRARPSHRAITRRRQ
jgi:hypothetical protein